MKVSKIHLFALAKLEFVIPAYLGIKYSLAGACTTTGLVPEMFVTDSPACVVVTDPTGKLTVTVTNLNTGSGLN
jgi:hypothetical protein